MPSNILIVDDDAMVRFGIGRALKRQGYQALEAESGHQALERFREGGVDLVILDLQMRGMNGFETCRNLRELPGGREVPILILTGNFRDNACEDALASGADDFLTKPILWPQLILRITSLLKCKGIFKALKDSVKALESQRQHLEFSRIQKQKQNLSFANDLKKHLETLEIVARTQGDNPHCDSWSEVLRETGRVRQLISEWADFESQDNPEWLPHYDRVDMKAFLQDCRKAFQSWAQARKQELIFDELPELGWVLLDPSMMLRCLENLLDNAFRYSPPQASVRIEVQTTEDSLLHISVSDEGPGIPEPFRESIFDMQTQLNSISAVSLKREHWGLGLFFCRIAVEAHGGRIWAEAKEPTGVRFCVELPLFAGTSAP